MFLYLPFVANTSESVFIGYADAVGNARRLTFDARILCLCILHTENQTFNFTLVERKFQKGIPCRGEILVVMAKRTISSRAS